MIEDYMRELELFSFLNREIRDLSEEVECGAVPTDEPSKLLDSLAQCKTRLIGLKSSLGLDDDLKFLEDASFVGGFQLKNGAVVGDSVSALEWARKKILDFYSIQDEERLKKHLLFEIGTYIFWLTK